MAIDKPTDKIREIVSTTDDLLFDGLVKTAGVFNIPAKFFSLQDGFDGADRKDRIRKAIFAVCDELERLGHSIDTPANAPWFKKGAETLVAEAARSADGAQSLAARNRVRTRLLFPIRKMRTAATNLPPTFAIWLS